MFLGGDDSYVCFWQQLYRTEFWTWAIRILGTFKILSNKSVIKNKHKNYLHPETMMHLFIRQLRNEKLLKGKNESLFLATAEFCTARTEKLVLVWVVVTCVFCCPFTILCTTFLLDGGKVTTSGLLEPEGPVGIYPPFLPRFWPIS